MRNLINLIESATTKPSEELLDALENWMHDFSSDAAYTNELDQKCQEIIELSRDHPVEYRGMLYRGTAIYDEYAQALKEGKAVTIPPLPKKLVSWTKSLDTALYFADYQAEVGHSAVVVAIRAPLLRTVVDLDLLYDARSNTGHESEVIVHNDPLNLSRSNIKHLWVYDPDTEDSIQIY